MSSAQLLSLVVAVVIAVPVAVWLRRYYSTDARLERRRRRSNSRIATKSKRPMVKFSVRTPKEKE